MNDRCDSSYESPQNPAYQSTLAHFFITAILASLSNDLQLCQISTRISAVQQTVCESETTLKQHRWVSSLLQARSSLKPPLGSTAKSGSDFDYKNQPCISKFQRFLISAVFFFLR